MVGSYTCCPGYFFPSQGAFGLPTGAIHTGANGQKKKGKNAWGL